MHDTLGTRLVEAGVITITQLHQALRVQREQGGSLGQVLLRLQLAPEDALIDAASHVYNVRIVDLSSYPIEDEAVSLISQEIAARHIALPISRSGRRLVVAMSSPTNVHAIQDITFITGHEVEPVLAPESALREAIERLYRTQIQTETIVEELPDDIEIEGVEPLHDEVDVADASEANEAPIVRLVNQLVVAAVKRGASDIHLEPYERRFRVRFRVDGQLIEIMTPPAKLRGAIISRLKIMADLDIAERRIPQDGRIKIKVDKRIIDLRVSTLPTVYGEKLVMRILDRSNLTVDLTRAGFQPEALRNFMQGIERPYGMVLVTGPTGSGKTTTLYSALTHLNRVDTNIMTAEDPVEYNLDGINQVQINEEVGLSFASALRAFLRQDPNVILIGEIRDAETASIATKAALTGHLLLSTLHTNDAPSSVTRLMDMGIEPFLVANSLNAIVAQRLVRRVCSNCREEAVIDAAMAERLGLPAGTRIPRGKGCSSCNNTGLRGRVGLFEVLTVTPRVRELILARGSSDEIKRAALQDGMISLRADGLAKLKAGLTSAEEVMKETASDVLDGNNLQG